MPNNDLLEKWASNLRSGKYTQTTCSLMNEEGNCCLGVACLTAGVPSGFLARTFETMAKLILNSKPDTYALVGPPRAWHGKA